jgi:hypothetical protein
MILIYPFLDFLQVTAFISRAINSRAHITELSVPSSNTDGATGTSAVDESTLSVDDIIAQEARELFDLLETWPSPLEPVSPRVDAGNKIYQKAAQVSKQMMDDDRREGDTSRLSWSFCLYPSWSSCRTIS